MPGTGTGELEGISGEAGTMLADELTANQAP